MPADSRQRPSRPRRRLRLRRLIVAGALLLVVAVYAKPLKTYLEKREQTAAKAAEVAQLRAENTKLARAVKDAVGEEAITREARRLLYVRPGEHIYIVKGIKAWRRANR